MSTIVATLRGGAMGDRPQMPDLASEPSRRERHWTPMTNPDVPPLPEHLLADGRISNSTRPWLVGFERAAWMTFRMAVLALTNGDGARTREWVAAQLDISPKTLEDWISPQGTSVPRFTSAWVVIGGLLRERERDQIGRYLASTLGLDCVGRAASTIDAAPLHLQAMQACTALGRVHHQVQAAMDPKSSGGTTITPTEAQAIIADVGELYRETSELLMTLSRIANGQAVQG